MVWLLSQNYEFFESIGKEFETNQCYVTYNMSHIITSRVVSHD